MQLREHTERILGIFLDDRLFGAESVSRQDIVQSKAVFSYAKTLMDNIRGSMHAYGSTKEALTREQILDRVQEEYFRKHIMSVMLCANWSVQVLLSIMYGYRQEQFSNRRRKC